MKNEQKLANMKWDLIDRFETDLLKLERDFAIIRKKILSEIIPEREEEEEK